MIEGKNVEFKREYMDDIKYAVIAFANTNGGKLYIGINDDGTIYGVDNVDDTMLRLTNMIRDIVRPDVTMFTDYSVEKMEHKDVIVLTVQRGSLLFVFERYSPGGRICTSRCFFSSSF